MSQASFAKRQREKARKEKAAMKAARRAERADAVPEEPDLPPAEDEDTVLADLAQLHERFDAGDIDFEDFAKAKDEITQRLRVE